MKQAAIIYSSHSPAAEKKAKELSLEYEGHSRMCERLADETPEAIAMSIYELFKMVAQDEGGQLMIHKIL